MLNIEKINEIYTVQEDTMEVDLCTYGSLKIRTSIDLNTQESFIDFVCNNVFDRINYYPARKESLIVTAFIQAFLVEEDDKKALLRTEGDDIDIYEVYKLVHDIGLINEIHNITVVLSQKIDTKIKYLIDRSNADIAGGAANVVLQTVEDMNIIMKSASEFLAVLKGAVSQNSKKLSSVLTKKNITTFLDNLGAKLEDAVKDGMKQSPIPRQ